MYNMILIMGKSGSGKDLLFKTVDLLSANLFNNEYINIVKMATTRPPRAGNKIESDYLFMTEEQFNKTETIAVSHFKNWCYGIPKAQLAENKVNIVIANPLALKKLISYQDVRILDILLLEVPDEERLRRQLDREVAPDASEIVRRFNADEEDFAEIDGQLQLVRKNNATVLDLISNAGLILSWAKLNNL